ncbi:MAG: hypothetical protein AAFQ74_21665 [Cyanobacteria bacterium J06623_4]
MAQQLKRWESPRRKGRNHKGRGGSAKQRQYKKRQKLLMKKLRQGDTTHANSPQTQKTKKGEASELLLFLSFETRCVGTWLKSSDFTH